MTRPIADRYALPAYQFFVTGVMGFLQPFLPLYIVAAGLSPQSYGYAAAIGTATCLLIQPLLGRLSDRLDARVPLMISAALLAGVAYSLFRAVPTGNFALVALLLACGANGFSYLNTASGVLVARLAAQTGEPVGAAYVRTRVWGSVGYVVIALTSGLLIRGGNLSAVPPRASLDTLFTFAPLLFLMIAGLCFVVPDPKSGGNALDSPRNALDSARNAPDSARNAPDSARKNVSAARKISSSVRNRARSVRNRARSVRKNGTVVQKNGFVVGNADKTPRLAAQIAHQLKTFAQNLTAPTPTANRRRFLLAFLLYQIALYGASAYLPLYLAALHASPAWLTATFAAGVVCEVLIMTQIGRWTDTHGRRPAMLLSFALLPLRLLLYIPATMPLHVLLVQTIHGFNFGILGTIAVVFVNDTASDDNRGAAQAELAATIGLAGSVAPIACGYLVQNVGIHAMFAVMSAVAAVSVALFCAFVAESHPGASGDWTNKLPRYLREPWFGRERERVAIK